jgi:hypothetical protein
MANNRDKALMMSQAYAVGDRASQPFSADGCKGLRLFVEVIARGTTGTVAVKVQVQDVIAKRWHDLPGAASGTLSAAGGKMLTIYPGITAVANQDIPQVLTGPFRLLATVVGEPVTFTVGGALLL